MIRKRARFCEEYVIDCNATQAALRAGYSERSAYAQGSRLLKDDEVKERVEELRAKHSERLEITIDSLTTMLLDDRTLAHDNRQAGAAVAASEKLAKIHGLIGDKLDIHIHKAPADLTDAEIGAELAEIKHNLVRMLMRDEGRAGIEAKIAKWERLLVEFDRGDFDEPAPAPLALPAPVSPHP